MQQFNCIDILISIID